MTRETLTRRAFAGAAASIALLSPITATATASGDPVLPLYAEWLETLAAWKALSDTQDDWDGLEMTALMDRHCAAGAILTDTIPTTREGIAAQVHVLWENHVGPSLRPDAPECQGQFWEDQNRLIHRIWEGATGKAMTEHGPFTLPLETAQLEA